MSKRDKHEILQEVLNIFEEYKVIITDSHIVYTSGKHGSAYVNKDAIYPHVGQISRLCEILAENFISDDVDAIIAPAIGGVILSQWTTHHLSLITDSKVFALYAEKMDDGFVIKRGYDKFIPGKRILVVEDILTTGDSAKKVIQSVRELGGEIIGLGVLCNRGEITTEQLDIPKLVSLLDVTLITYEENECPLCKEGVPINIDVGKGRKYLSKR